MKKTTLSITASIRRHVMHTLFIADLLAEEFNIYYVIINDILKEIVVKSTYNAVQNYSFRPCINVDGRFLTEEKKDLLFGMYQKPFRTIKFMNTISRNRLNY